VLDHVPIRAHDRWLDLPRDVREEAQAALGHDAAVEPLSVGVEVARVGRFFAGLLNDC